MLAKAQLAQLRGGSGNSLRTKNKGGVRNHTDDCHLRGGSGKSLRTNLRPPPGECATKSILEMAEKIADLDKTSAEKLKDQYKESAGKNAKERWARVDIIAGIIAAEVEEVE